MKLSSDYVSDLLLFVVGFMLPSVLRSLSSGLTSLLPAPCKGGYPLTMTRHFSFWMQLGRPALAFLILLLFVNCGGKKSIYYKEGGDQALFDLDAKACLAKADMMARAKMADPARTPDPVFVRRYYEECIYTKGWTKIPPDRRDRSLWRWKGQQLFFDTFTLTLPSGFSLRTQSKWIVGPTWSHQLEAEGPNKRTYIVLVAQENISDRFEKIDYPSPPGYEFYTGGRLDKFDIRWSVFTGRFQGNLVAILGTYIYPSKRQRISVVFSRFLTASGQPIGNFDISEAQKEEMENLYASWLTWFKVQTGAREADEKPGFLRYFRVLP